MWQRGNVCDECPCVYTVNSTSAKLYTDCVHVFITELYTDCVHVFITGLPSPLHEAEQSSNTASRCGSYSY